VGTMTKVFIVLTSVLSIAVSCLFIAAAAQMANWKELAQDYQRLQEAEFTARMNLQTTLEAALAMKDDALREKTQIAELAQKQQQDLANQLADAKNELARRTNEAVAADAGRVKLQEILDVQTAELTALRKQTQTLLTQNVDLQTRNSRLNSRVLELTSNVTIMTDQIRNLQEKLYVAEQQVAQLQQQFAGGRRLAAAPGGVEGVIPVAATVPGPIRGEVVDVEGNYASINIGESSGVTSGMTFMVHRGATFIAELVIDRVRSKEAGGKLTTIQEQVRPGDTVTYGL